LQRKCCDSLPCDDSANDQSDKSHADAQSSLLECLKDLVGMLLITPMLNLSSMDKVKDVAFLAMFAAVAVPNLTNIAQEAAEVVLLMEEVVDHALVTL